MICPHCSASLRRKQRYRSRCSRCRKTFALEPKDNSLRLHDLRVRKLAEVLADPLRPGAAPLRYTVDQLRLAASRKTLANPDRVSGWLGCAIAVTFFGVVALFLTLFARSAALTGSVFLVVAMVVTVLLIGHAATARQRKLAGEPMSAEVFHGLLERWARVYRALPPGLLLARPVVDVWPPGPPVALLYCADAGTLVFLAASGIVERRGVALIVQGREWPREWPPASLLAAVQADRALPVLVLHHADPAGCLTVPRLRAVLPPGTRVIDAGLRPRVAQRAGPPVCLPPDRAPLDELANAGVVDDDEHSWLAKGNTFPLAAVRPARLLMAVERALTHVDPEEGRAAALGFMAWPERAR